MEVKHCKNIFEDSNYISSNKGYTMDFWLNRIGIWKFYDAFGKKLSKKIIKLIFYIK